ncbi:unnamed protein product [Protopolystoma xenopodis]|uniref:Uncharacterized protein n=1 Tax=Protopolystoma xenopodis TaxID=117903 RepID=A0A448WBW0_9PLAT|nr:unnamed protein product [Protopolystoma xenopodis]
MSSLFVAHLPDRLSASTSTPIHPSIFFMSDLQYAPEGKLSSLYAPLLYLLMRVANCMCAYVAFYPDSSVNCLQRGRMECKEREWRGGNDRENDRERNKAWLVAEFLVEITIQIKGMLFALGVSPTSHRHTRLDGSVKLYASGHTDWLSWHMVCLRWPN